MGVLEVGHAVAVPVFVLVVAAVEVPVVVQGRIPGMGVALVGDAVGVMVGVLGWGVGLGSGGDGAGVGGDVFGVVIGAVAVPVIPEPGGAGIGVLVVGHVVAVLVGDVVGGVGIGVKVVLNAVLVVVHGGGRGEVLLGGRLARVSGVDAAVVVGGDGVVPVELVVVTDVVAVGVWQEWIGAVDGDLVGIRDTIIITVWIATIRTVADFNGVQKAIAI